MHYAPAFVQEEKISMGGIKALDEEPASVDGSRLLQEPAPVFDAFACAAATCAPARNMKALQGLGLGNDLTLHYAPWLFAFPVDRFSQRAAQWGQWVRLEEILSCCSALPGSIIAAPKPPWFPRILKFKRLEYDTAESGCCSEASRVYRIFNTVLGSGDMTMWTFFRQALFHNQNSKTRKRVAAMLPTIYL